MSWTPTDEQVEKAAWQVADWLSDRDEGPSEAHREAARAVLVAVGPLIAEAAWDEGYTRGFYDSQPLPNTADASEGSSENPYIEKEAGR